MRLALVFGLLLLFSCNGNEQSDTDQLNESDSTQVVKSLPDGEPEIMTPEEDKEIKVYESGSISLTEIKADPSEASLSLNTRTFLEGANKLNFEVNGVGDHKIAYLANNHYLSYFSSDVFEMEFLYGNNVFLAFLTDPNDIAIKSNEGCVLKNAIVGDMENMFDMNQPHLFYYLPKQETQELILDFYLVNTQISDSGNKVKVTLNDQEFVIDKWAAYKIEGVKSTGNTIRIQLIDKNGEPIEGPFNDSGERTFSLQSQNT